MGNAVTGGIDRSALEKQWANHAARTNLSREDKLLWDTARYTVRPYVYFDKVLIAWTVVQGEPQVKEIFKVVSIEASFADGIWLTLEAEIAQRRVTLSHSPKRLLPDLELLGWLPYFNELRYASADWNDLDAKKNLRLHLCLKARGNGEDTRVPLVDGQDYLSEMHIFKQLFPRYNTTRF